MSELYANSGAFQQFYSYRRKTATDFRATVAVWQRKLKIEKIIQNFVPTIIDGHGCDNRDNCDNCHTCGRGDPPKFGAEN